MTSEIARCIQEVEDQGFSIAEGTFSRDFCDEIMEEIERLEAIGPPALKPSEFVGYSTQRYFDLLNEGQVWQRVATHPLLLEVLQGVLGEDVLLSTMGTAVIGPGEPAQAIHCDDQLYGMKRPHKNLVCNTMWALSDFTEETGATRVVPGSHKSASYAKPGESHDTVGVVMPRGSVAFVVGTCYHGAGANTSEERRWALTINYCAGCMRQQENLMLAVGRERAESFPQELQNLIGYRISSLGVGHVNAGDPRQVLTWSRG